MKSKCIFICEQVLAFWRKRDILGPVNNFSVEGSETRDIQ